MTDTVWGDVLRIDLTTGKTSREPMSRQLKRDYIGGRGVNSRLLYEGVKPGTDPLGPQNP